MRMRTRVPGVPMERSVTPPAPSHEDGHSKGVDMGLGDKIKNAAEDAAGKVKEGVGKATDDERLQAEGEAQQAEAEARKKAEHAKDTVKDAADKAKNRLE